MRNTLRAFLSSLAIAGLALLLLPNEGLADVAVSGDTTPAAATISDAGGPVGGDLIIGDTGIAGLFMDIAPPLIGTLAPLESDDGIIANQEGSIGAATLEDFLGGDWIVNNNFIVGNAGQAFLDLFDSASVTVTNRATFGALEPGAGVATINGQGSRIITDELYIGDLGYGQLDVTDRAILVSGQNGGDSVIGSQDGGIGVIGLTDIGSRWTVGNTTTPSSLFIGNDMDGSSTAQGTLKIVQQALVQVSDTVEVHEFGRVELASGGRLRILPSSPTLNAIINNGVVKGDGFVDFQDHSFVNGPTGEIRNEGNAVNPDFGTNQREKLVFTAEAATATPTFSLTNNGTIESLGGEMEFQVSVQNNLEIVARDAVLRFPNGLSNNPGGTISLGGDTTLHGGVLNNGGNIHILTNSASTIVGDLTFTAAGILGLAVGSDPGSLDIIGSADLTGALFSLDYSAGVAPVLGDSYQILQATDGIAGVPLGTLAAAGGVLWDITTNITMDRLFATFNGAIAVPEGADFNGDNIVNALDLAIWQANYGNTGTPGTLAGIGDADSDGDVDGADFLLWQAQFGGDGIPLSSVLTSVPEPTSLTLLLGTLLLVPGRRGTRR